MKRIIICGPTCSGKTFLKNRLCCLNLFQPEISYTSRIPREGEIQDLDYHFLNKDEFTDLIKNDTFFYEFVKYGEIYYGTSYEQWNSKNLFIMETAGIQLIAPSDRRDCLIIYLNPPLKIRENRMKEERNWPKKQILQRRKIDLEKFINFSNYDLIIRDPYF